MTKKTIKIEVEQNNHCHECDDNGAPIGFLLFITLNIIGFACAGWSFWKVGIWLWLIALVIMIVDFVKFYKREKAKEEKKKQAQQEQEKDWDQTLNEKKYERK